jgi:hypothetical protein
MARKNTPRGIGRPFPKPRARAPAVVPAKAAVETEPEIPSTKEEIIASMGELCDRVDALLAKERGSTAAARDIGHLWSASPEWRKLGERRTNLVNALRKLLYDEQDALRDQGEEAVDLDDYVRDKLTAKPGTVPSFARPGKFVIWIDWIPMCCEWDGFMVPWARFCAVAPSQPWMNADGERDLPSTTIHPQHATIEAMFRDYAIQLTVFVGHDKGRRVPTFRIAQLSAEGREQAKTRANDWDWWLGPILKRGPVNPIPMPNHIAAVQMSLA